MQVVVIGNGSLGDSLIEFICKEGHNVTVIDEDTDEVSAVVNKYDVLGVTGNGASVEIQTEADVGNADVVISVAASDELNLLCCMIAKQLGAKHTIARVRDPRYLNQRAFMCNQLGIDMIVNPEYEAAREACRLIRFPAAMKLEKFAQGQVEVVEISIGENHPFVNLPLVNFKSKYNTNALICAAKHGDNVIIPGGNYVISAGDTISIAASRKDITDLFVKIGLLGKQLSNVMVVGGNSISRYLAAQLSDGKYKLKILEQDEEVCETLSELFPRATVICGDATDPDLLDDEGIDATDACVVMTASDQKNFIISLFAKTRGVKKIISRLSSPSFTKLSLNSGIDTNISPQVLVASKVLRYIRGLSGKEATNNAGAIKSLYKLVDGKVEALEFDVSEDFEFTDTPLRNIRLKRDLIVVALIRESAVIYPNGETVLKAGDSVIVMTTNEHLCELGDILA